MAASSKLPPMPTPTRMGGQGLDPDSATRRMTYSRIPFQPWAGASIMTRDMFSEPPPLAIIQIFEAVARRQIEVDDGRGVVADVGPGERIAGGLAQVAVPVAPDHAVVDGLPQAPSRDLHVLADLDEKDAQAAVLAQRQARGPGQTGVLGQLAEDLPGGWRRFGRLGPDQGRPGRPRAGCGWRRCTWRPRHRLWRSPLSVAWGFPPYRGRPRPSGCAVTGRSSPGSSS